MNTSMADDRLLRILVSGACLVVIVAGIKAMASVLNIIFLAWLLAYAISPLPNWMIRKRVPKIPAGIITLLIVVLGGIAIATVMSYSIIGLSQRLPVYQNTLTDTYAKVVHFLAANGVSITQSSPLAKLTPSRIFGFAGMVLAQIGNILGNTLQLLILVAIFLFEFLEGKKHPPQQSREEMSLFTMFQEASKGVKVYVTVTSSTGALQAAINIVLYVALGIDFAVIWGILFFFMNFIPIIGGFVAIIPPVVLGFLESGWKVALGVLVLFTINNFIWDNFLKPRFMGESLNIPFWAIILSAIFWSWVLGSIGLILAVPLTMVVRNLYFRENILEHSQRE